MKVVRSKCLLSHYPNDSRCKRLENIPRLNIPHARPKHGPSLRLAWGASIQVLILKLRAITLSCLTPFSLSAHIRCVHPLPTFMFTVPTLPRRQADSGPGRLTVIAHDMDVEGLHQDAAAEADLQIRCGRALGSAHINLSHTSTGLLFRAIEATDGYNTSRHGLHRQGPAAATLHRVHVVVITAEAAGRRQPELHQDAP